MKIEIDTDDIIEQIKEDISDRIDYWIRNKVDEIVSAQVMVALNKQLDKLEKTPYNVIHHRVYNMLDRYIEQEVENRIWEQECNGQRNKGE